MGWSGTVQQCVIHANSAQRRIVRHLGQGVVRPDLHDFNLEQVQALAGYVVEVVCAARSAARTSLVDDAPLEGQAFR